MIVTLTFGQECEEPTNLADVLVSQLQDIYSDPSSFLLAPDFMQPYSKDIRGERLSLSHLAKLRKYNHDCSAALQFDRKEKDLELKQASTCPWRVRLNVNLDRIPSSIIEAECTCKQCVQYDSKCSKDKGRPCYSHLGRCEKVFASQVTITRHCNRTTGVYEYKSGLFPVAVGCTCVRDVAYLP